MIAIASWTPERVTYLGKRRDWEALLATLASTEPRLVPLLRAELAKQGGDMVRISASGSVARLLTPLIR